ncbi:MAG: hypothetical protein AAFY06_17130 [Pseudomonadota bacterium]
MISTLQGRNDRTKPMRILLCTASLALLTACGNSDVTDTLHGDATPQNISAQTATYFETSRSNVAIGNLKPGVFGTAYKAKVAGTLFDCHYFKQTVSCNRA